MRALLAPALRRGINSGFVLCMLVAVSADPGVAAGEAAPRPQQRAILGADGSRYTAFIAEAAHRFGLPAGWIHAVIVTESGGDAYAVSPAGALGLMQLMPATWQFERAHLALGPDPFNARDNILAGTDYLSAMRNRYGVIGMLAAYNAGPGRYDAYRRGERMLPAETLTYLHKLTPVVAGDRSSVISAEGLLDASAWAHAPLFVTRTAIEPNIVAVANIESPPTRTDHENRRFSAADRPRDNDIRAAAGQSVDRIFVVLDGDQS